MMNTNKKKIIRISAIVIGVSIAIAGAIGYYMFNQPARDVQATKTDFRFTASQIVNEYLTNSKEADAKYLDEGGNSKILEISGVVANISEDFNKQKVVLLKSPADSAGVNCTFTSETNEAVNQIKTGETIVVKGVIRLGASYDKDLGMYENVVMDKCKIVPTKQ